MKGQGGTCRSCGRAIRGREAYEGICRECMEKEVLHSDGRREPSPPVVMQIALPGGEAQINQDADTEQVIALEGGLPDNERDTDEIGAPDVGHGGAAAADEEARQMADDAREGSNGVPSASVPGGLEVETHDQLAEAACLSFLSEDLRKLEALCGELGARRTQAIVGGIIAFVLTGLSVAVSQVAALRQEYLGQLLGIDMGDGAKIWLPAVLGGLIAVVVGLRFASARKRLQGYEPGRRLRCVRLGALSLATEPTSLGTFVHDRSGLVAPMPITFPSEEAADALRTVLREHGRLVASMPPVLAARDRSVVRVAEDAEQHLFAEEARLHANYEEARGILDSLEACTERVPLLALARREAASLLKCCEGVPTLWSAAPPVSVAKERSDDDVRRVIRQLCGEIAAFDDAGSKRSQVEGFLGEFLQVIESDLLRLSQMRDESLRGVLRGFSRDLEKLTTISSYNFYCPECNDETIRLIASGGWDSSGGEFPRLDVATRVRVVPGTNEWECPVCGARTETPFPVHRLLDELVYPSMDRLLQENRVERIRLYHAAEQKKAELLREESREVREMKESCEREVRAVEARIRETASSVTSTRRTIELLMAELVAFEALAQSRIAEVGRDVEAAAAEIDAYRRETIGAFERSMAELGQRSAAKLEHLAVVARQEDQARMAIMHDIASNTGRTAAATERTASATERTATATERVAAGQERMVGAMQSMSSDIGSKLDENNTLTGSIARSHGAFKAKFPNVVGMVGEKLGDVKQGVLGQKTYDRERGRVKKQSRS